jgi:hypothetical protein
MPKLLTPQLMQLPPTKLHPHQPISVPPRRLLIERDAGVETMQVTADEKIEQMVADEKIEQVSSNDEGEFQPETPPLLERTKGQLQPETPPLLEKTKGQPETPPLLERTKGEFQPDTPPLLEKMKVEFQPETPPMLERTLLERIEALEEFAAGVKISKNIEKLKTARMAKVIKTMKAEKEALKMLAPTAKSRPQAKAKG